MNEDLLREMMLRQAKAEKLDQPKSYFKESHRRVTGTKTERRIQILLAFFSEHPDPISPPELHQKTQIPLEAVRRLCQRLALEKQLVSIKKSDHLGSPVLYASPNKRGIIKPSQ